MSEQIDWLQAPGEEVVCHCLQVNKMAIVAAIQAGAYTVPLVKAATQAGRGKDCQRRHPEGRNCEPDIEKLIELYGDGTKPMADCGCGCGCK